MSFNFHVPGELGGFMVVGGAWCAVAGGGCAGWGAGWKSSQ